jgi:hypothetical protein
MEILRWVRWQWRQWEVWQKAFVLAMFFMGMSVGAPEPLSLYFLGVGIIIVFGFTFKWAVYDVVKDSYAKYKRQRDGLFETIKGE